MVVFCAWLPNTPLQQTNAPSIVVAFSYSLGAFAAERQDVRQTLCAPDMNGILTVWVITWRTIWPAMLVALGLPISIVIARRRTGFAPLQAFWIPLLPPIAVIVWSGTFWAGESRRAAVRVSWMGSGLAAITIVGICVLLVTAFVFRRSPRPWTVVLALVANLAFLIVAWLIGTMAISDAWL